MADEIEKNKSDEINNENSDDKINESEKISGNTEEELNEIQEVVSVENPEEEIIESEIKKTNKFKAFIENAFDNDSKFKWLSVALLFIIVFLTYSNIYNNSVHFDDDFIIYNPKLHNPAALMTIFDLNKFRLIPFMSFAMNYYFSGENLASYYFINILIHFLNSVLVFAVVRLLFKTQGIKDHPIAKYANYFSLIAALIFACHPLQTQAVAYIYQRLASIATLFYLAAIYFYIKARVRKKGFFKKFGLIIICFIFVIFGIFSKENAVTIPITIILLEVTFFTKKFRFIYAAIIISLVLAAIGIYYFYELKIPEKYLYHNAFFVKIFYPQPNYNGEIVESRNYFITQFKVIPEYFLQLFFPFRQNFDHDIRMVSNFKDSNVILGISFIAITLIIASYYYSKNRLIFFGIFWIYITISVESSILPLADVMFEHRVYLPMLGFATLLIGIIWEILNHKQSAYKLFMGFLILCGIYSGMSYFRNMVWKSEYTLWSDASEKSPNKARTRFQKGLAALEESKIEEALKEFQKTIDILPTFQSAYSQRAYIFFNMRRYNEAIEEYTKYIDHTKKTYQYQDGFLNRARTFAKLPNWEMALADYDKYLKLKPKDVNVMMEVAEIRVMLKQPDEAILLYRKALKADPKFSMAAFKIGKSLFDSEKYQECIQEFTTTIENSSENLILLSEAFNYRGTAYFKIKDNMSSLIDFENAVSLNPNNLSAFQNKIILHRNMGEYDKELETINQIAVKMPDDLSIRYARAKCLIKLKRNDEAIKDLEFLLSKQADYKDANKILKGIKGKK